jgi:type VI secretion system protein ImpH
MIPKALSALADRVRANVARTALFPLIRRLERDLGREAAVGSDLLAECETVHFSHPARFVYPAGEIADVRFTSTARGIDATVATTLLGLLGTESPLPPSLSEDVLLFDDDERLQRFYDVFQHRAIALLYRMWKGYSSTTAPKNGGDSTFSSCLESLVGIDAFSPYPRQVAMPAPFALGLSDFSRCEPGYLDPAGLEQVLERIFPELAPRVTVPEPRSVQADQNDLTRLGERHATLGVDAAYGSSALDPAGVLRLTLGPVGRTTYEELLPGGRRYLQLQPLVDELLAARAMVELEVLIPHGEAPSIVLAESFGATLGVDARHATHDTPYVRVRFMLLADASAAVLGFDDGE